MTVPIPSDFEDFVDDVLTDGRFENRSEVVRAGLQLLRQREQLRHDIEAGVVQLDDGQGIPAEDVLDRLERKAKDFFDQTSR